MRISFNYFSIYIQTTQTGILPDSSANLQYCFNTVRHIALSKQFKPQHQRCKPIIFKAAFRYSCKSISLRKAMPISKTIS
jgi:hypothetical protein